MFLEQNNDKLQEECGIIGFGNENNFDTSEMIYLGLHGIQHRGQQTAGIAINDSGKIIYHKELGLVTEVFNEIVLKHLSGKNRNGLGLGLGHVGYNAQSENQRENAQPLVIRYTRGQMGISYNGFLLNAGELRQEFENMGSILQTTSDAEVIAHLISRERLKVESIEEAIVNVMKYIKGAYSFLVMTPKKLIAVRDASGMKPLCIGKIEDSYIFASETSALNTLGATFIRDVRPGEIVILKDGKLEAIETKQNEKTSLCIFELVYLARTDSYIDGINVYQARYEAGRVLARELPVDVDVVVGVPDSGIPAALGFSKESGIPYAEGLVKNRYIGRTFIQPSQAMRERAVELKLNSIRSQLEGKKIVLIDDSIVRGTTSKKIVQMLRETGGVKEIHMRISSPPVKFSCHYGIDTPNEELLIANNYSVDDIKGILGVDSLGFLSQEGFLETPVGAKCGFCTACFNGVYPIVYEEEK